MSAMTMTVDTRVMDQYEMRAYLEELTREQREGIIYNFVAAGRRAPSESTIELIAQAEGMGYVYDIETGHFMMEKPEEHDFIFWNIPVLGTIDSETGAVTFADSPNKKQLS